MSFYEKLNLSDHNLLKYVNIIPDFFSNTLLKMGQDV
jgi:hypothetical protein